jgi:hypothetical protein
MKLTVPGAVFWVDGLLSTACQAVQGIEGPFITAERDCDDEMFSLCEEVKVERSLLIDIVLLDYFLSDFSISCDLNISTEDQTDTL